MRTVAKSVFEILPTLSAMELQQVQERCSVLLMLPGIKQAGIVQHQGKVKSTGNNFAQCFYEALVDAIKQRIKSSHPPWGIFIRVSKQYELFLLTSGVVEDANAKWFPDQTRAQRASMLRLYARLILDYMVDHKMTLVWPVVSNTVAALPGILDQAFPGYISAGLIGTVQNLRVVTGHRNSAHVDT